MIVAIQLAHMEPDGHGTAGQAAVCDMFIQGDSLHSIECEHGEWHSLSSPSHVAEHTQDTRRIEYGATDERQRKSRTRGKSTLNGLPWEPAHRMEEIYAHFF